MAEHKAVRFGRRAAAFLLVGAVGYLGAVSHFSPRWRVCEDLVAQVGEVPLARRCRPLTPTDLPVLAAATLAALLLARDFQELELIGLLKWKSRVEETERRQVELQEKVASLAVAVNTAQAVHVNVNPPTSDVDLQSAVATALSMIPKKEALLRDE